MYFMGLKLMEISNRVATVEIHYRTGCFEGYPYKVVDLDAVTTKGDYLIRGYREIDVDEALKRFVSEMFVCDRYFITDEHFECSCNRYCCTDVYKFDLHTVEKL
jgi:hypothetical protein